MKECSKSIQRRLVDSNFLRRYFVGEGIDIGGMPDPLLMYQEFFPLMRGIKTWDWEDGDAQYLSSVGDETLDFVHSSHCLEHLVDPMVGLHNWLRVLKPGGFLVVTVPDEDLYEQGEFPSTFNCDHKWTFTIFKYNSWSDKSINLLDLVKNFGEIAELMKLELLTATHRFNLPRFDQTLTPVGECGIELVMRKRLSVKLDAATQRQQRNEQPVREVRLHLNQYLDDMLRMKNANKDLPPFQNDKPL